MNNIMQLLQAIKSGQNPDQLMISMLQNQIGNNPIGQNLIKMAQNNDTKGIEQVARNLCAQRGLNFDTEFAAFRKQLGL